VNKPRQGLLGLWNISFGFFGIQAAFGLQNANVSRIFQSLGGSVDNLAFLWIAGPVTGLLVQPLIGHFSDRTWGPLGRRRPYFLAGAVLAAGALIGMPLSVALIGAALLLWVLDASLNVSMEPFRAFVGDMVGDDQRAAGYAFQTAFIGAGAVVGSLAPQAMTLAGIANTAAPGVIPPSVRYSFYLGAAAIVLAVAWTVISTREYPPDQMGAFEGVAPAEDVGPEPLVAPRRGAIWLAAGAVLLVLVWRLGLDKQLYVLGGALAAYGLAQILNRRRVLAGAPASPLAHILSDLAQMPQAMGRLAVAQMFTWLALFIMWIYTTPVVTQTVFGATDTASKAYNDGADWVGVLFSIYNGVAAAAAFLLPPMARRLGASRTHLVCLLAGAASYASILVIHDAKLLILPMIGVGIAWASILTMPYVILSTVLPPRKFGVYMGLFNIFIVLPQLLVATLMGAVIRTFFPGRPIWTMLVAALVMGLAAMSMLRVKSPEPTTAQARAA
jgi:maltose/moltooligosaccharide transporter